MSKFLFLMMASISLLGIGLSLDAFGNEYFAAYPDIAKRSATHVYQTCDFGATTSTITADTKCIASAAMQNNADTLSGYGAQNFVEYRNSNDKLFYHSQVWRIYDSNGGSPGGAAVNFPHNCETISPYCKDLGAESDIDKVKTSMYWLSGTIKFYVEKYPNTGSATAYFNPTYTPDTSDDISTKFASGTQSFTVGATTTKVKLTQWGVEGEVEAANWELKQHEMFTYFSPTSSNFANDKAVTTDPTGTSTTGSKFLTRVIDGVRQYATVGDTKYCVDRTNNVNGEIMWEATTTSCESINTTFWN